MIETARESIQPDPEVSVRVAWREALGVAAYGVAWALGFYVSTYYWFLPAGLRFACLWWMPRRLWLWLALAEFAAILGVVLSAEDGYSTWLGFLLGVFVPWFIHAGVIAVAQRGVERRLPDTPWRMARLLLAMVAAATLTALALTLMSEVEGGTVAQEGKIELIAFAIGDFIGMLIVTPIWLHLASARRRELGWRPFAELVWMFVPMLAVVALVPTLRPQVVVYAAVLALVPMIVMVFRHGWEGGGWALALTGIAVYVLGVAFDATVVSEVMQLFLAIVGSISLMLGAAVRALRSTRDTLAARNATLAAQALEMRELGERLVRAQEDEQRRLAQELQSELEQGMTALGTRLGLLARTPLEPAQMAAIDSLRGLSQEIHASMREALLRLRPLLLDRHGLETTLRSGPLRDLLVDAGVRYDLIVRGSAGKLDPDVQSALYRICQEAATDCVRRTRAREFTITLDADDVDTLGVRLRVSYDGEFRSDPRDATLPATRDRVLALGGDYRCDVCADRLEHNIRVPGMAAAQDASAVS
jgi:glucose-6-phosphate-specific signal transduction histidine kinase